IEVIAPPGIPIEAKRTLVRELTDVARARLWPHQSARCARLARSAQGRGFRQQWLHSNREPRHGAVRGGASARLRSPGRGAAGAQGAGHGECVMKHKLVRYKVKPEAVAENRHLVEAVFEALQARAPEDVSYMVIELGDGSFVHLKTDLTEGAFELGELPAFQAFR